MHKIYPNLSRWLSFHLLLCCLQVHAQHPLSPRLTATTNRQISFIVHAPVMLPALWKQQQYENLRNYLGNWRNAEYPSLELIFGAEILLAINTGTFAAYSLPCDGLVYLSDYARELQEVTTQGAKFKYYLQLKPPYRYDATEEARKTILIIQTWARDLLTRPGLKTDELFICRALAGEIPNPETALHADPGACPRLTRMQRNINSYNNALFTARRNAWSGTAAVLVGWWIPTGRLRQELGTHPSVGMQLGVRNKKNEYDFTWNVRFGYPTPRTYTFLRDDTLYSTNYYDGGYVGLEYTRYVVHTKHVDLGYTTGIAYDYFSIADGWSDHPSETHLQPINVGSFDWNYGLRVKYFLKRKSFIGLTVKYHLIHYDNTGGTNLDGDAYTVDLSFGSH